MPPLNLYKDQLDYSSYFTYSSGKSSSRFASPFDEDNIHGKNKLESPQPPLTRPLFLNFTADLNPHNGGKKQKVKKSSSYKVNGVNILNRKSIDSSTALERLQKRRENHNSVERKRRDNINATIMEISQLLPDPDVSSKPNKGNILKLAAEYIKRLKCELKDLKNEIRVLKGEEPLKDDIDDSQDIRKRKSIDKESFDESEEENELDEKEGLRLDNEDDSCSSERISRHTSSEPEVSLLSNNTRESEETRVGNLTQDSSSDEIKIKPTTQMSTSSKSNLPDDNKPDQSSVSEQTVSVSTLAPEPVSNIISTLPDSDGFNSIECTSSFPSYPILGGSKRFRADTHTLPGMVQLNSMNTPTLSHMHTLNASTPRSTTPVSPFGFQLPAPHTTPLPTPTNSHPYFVSHVPSVQSHLPSHPHSRGPPHMMFREFNGNMNMY